jgi:DNA-binding PadR family transcriptional regulator
MDDMEIMTRGWWRPSPGSIYPLLEELSTEGAIRRRDDGQYELTESAAADTGGSWIHSPRTPKEVVTELAGLASYLEDVVRTDAHAAESISAELKGVVRRLERLVK